MLVFLTKKPWKGFYLPRWHRRMVFDWTAMPPSEHCVYNLFSRILDVPTHFSSAPTAGRLHEHTRHWKFEKSESASCLKCAGNVHTPRPAKVNTSHCVCHEGGEVGEIKRKSNIHDRSFIDRYSSKYLRFRWSELCCKFGRFWGYIYQIIIGISHG